MDDILEGYAAAATPSLIARYESFDFQKLYAPVFDLMPEPPVRVADIGAGTGRDAAWLAAKGHRVLAIEPVRELRESGMKLHPSANVTWDDDRLPKLAKSRRRGPFEMIILCGVWQHIDENARGTAIATISCLTAIGGLVIMSLRHGPGALGRRVFPISTEKTIVAAERSGLSLLRQSQAESIQVENRAAGVHWTWLAFKKMAEA